MEELKYAYDYLQGIVQQWIAVTDWTRCQVQCHCSLCLCLYRDKVGQCPKCFEKYGHKRGHKNCGFSKETSYFLRFHKDDPQGKGLYWKEIAHGSTEEEAKRHVDSERLKEKAKEEVRAKMEVKKRKIEKLQAQNDFDQKMQVKVLKALQEAYQEWIQENPSMAQSIEGGALGVNDVSNFLMMFPTVNLVFLMMFPTFFFQWIFWDSSFPNLPKRNPL